MTLPGETICRYCFHSSLVHGAVVNVETGKTHESLVGCRYCHGGSEEFSDYYCPRDALE